MDILRIMIKRPGKAAVVCKLTFYSLVLSDVSLRCMMILKACITRGVARVFGARGKV